MTFYDFDEISTDVFYAPNNYVHEEEDHRIVFNNSPDIRGYDKIGIHMCDDYSSFFDGKDFYSLPDLISRMVLDHVWEPQYDIWFWCCQAGKANITQSLSNITGAHIKAPDGYLVVGAPDFYIVSDLRATEFEKILEKGEDAFWNFVDSIDQSSRWIDIHPCEILSTEENDCMYDTALAIIKRKGYDIAYNVQNLDEWWALLNAEDAEVLNNPSLHPSNNRAGRRQLWGSFQF